MTTEYVGISQAARIMGVSRSILQRKLKTGEITSFEGKVSISQLKSSCPTATIMDTSPILERMEFIKDNAYANRIVTAYIPESHILLNKLKRARLNLKMERQQNLRYLHVINKLREKLHETEVELSDESQKLATQLLQLISTHLNQPLSKKYSA